MNECQNSELGPFVNIICNFQLELFKKKKLGQQDLNSSRTLEPGCDYSASISIVGFVHILDSNFHPCRTNAQSDRRRKVVKSRI